MKKVHSLFTRLIFVFIVSITTLHAQDRKPDVIVKKDNTKIEAVIQEVDKILVKYKKYSDPTGPNFTIEKSEIASILYGNGEVENFTQDPALTSVGSVPLAGPPIPKDEFQRNILRLESSELRTLYKKNSGSGGLRGGIIWGTLSLGCLVGGIIAVSEATYPHYYTGEIIVDEEQKTAGILLATVGTALTGTAAILCFSAHGRRRSKARFIRTELIRRQEPLTVRVQPMVDPVKLGGGLRLTMNF